MDIWIVEHKTLYVAKENRNQMERERQGIQEFNIDLSMYLKKGDALERAWKLAQEKIVDVEYNENGNYVNKSSSGHDQWPDDTIIVTHKFFDFKGLPSITYKITDKNI